MILSHTYTIVFFVFHQKGWAVNWDSHPLESLEVKGPKEWWTTLISVCISSEEDHIIIEQDWFVERNSSGNAGIAGARGGFGRFERNKRFEIGRDGYCACFGWAGERVHFWRASNQIKRKLLVNCLTKKRLCWSIWIGETGIVFTIERRC